MEIIRKKLFDIIGSTYSRKNKCNNRQIDLSGNEQRLLYKQRSIPKKGMEKVDLFALK
jgi:hypothetical protein